MSLSKPLMLITAITLSMSVSKDVQAQVIAEDRFESNINLSSFSADPAPGSYSSPGDGFEIYQVGVSASIPFSLVDDSFSAFPADVLGIIHGSTDSPGFIPDNAWFGVIDTVNNDNLPAGNPGVATATWDFDISSATTDNLDVSIDMGAMGNFEDGTEPQQGENPIVADVYDWTYSIDSGSFLPLFTTSVDRDATHDYTMASGTVVNLDGPVFMTNVQNQTVMLDNNLQTLTSMIAADTGSTLTLMLTANTDGGVEAYAFDNIVISGSEVDPPGDLFGDFNASGETEIDDLNLVLFNWGLPDGDLPISWVNERPIDGTVDAGELNQVLFNWGATSPMQVGTVPEPASWSILLLGALGIVGGRRQARVG